MLPYSERVKQRRKIMKKEDIKLLIILLIISAVMGILSLLIKAHSSEVAKAYDRGYKNGRKSYHQDLIIENRGLED
jgi:hypothetical protein